MIKSFFKNWEEISPFVLLSVFMIVLHFLSGNFADDVARQTDYEQMGFWPSIEYFSETWSSLYIGLFITMLFSAVLPRFCWCIFDTALIVAMAGCFSYFVQNIMNVKNKKFLNWIIVIGILCYPIYDMGTAGWIVTTTVYIFPLAFAILSLIPIVKLRKGERIPVWEYIFYFIAANIGCNNAQTNVLVIFFYLLFIINFLFEKRKPHPFMFVNLFVGIAWIINVFISPGNQARKVVEYRVWMDYDMYSFVQKIKVTTATTTNNFMQGLNAVFIFLCLGLVLCIWQKSSNKLYRFLSVVPLFGGLKSVLVTIGIGAPSSLPYWLGKGSAFPLLNLIFPLDSSDPAEIMSLNSIDYQMYPLMFQIFIFLVIALLLYLIWGNTKKMILFEAVYVIGIATRLAMYYSPSLYISGPRTFICMYAMLIFIAVCLFVKFFNERTEVIGINNKGKIGA